MGTAIIPQLMEEERIYQLIARKLSGEASQDELSELETLLHSNPEMHYAVQNILDLWKSGNQDKSGLSERALQAHLDRMQQLGISFGSEKAVPAPGSRKFFPNYFLWAGFLILAFSGMLLLMRTKSPSQTESSQPDVKNNSIISTRNGSKTKLVLPDGTQVWLNAGSNLSYDRNYGNTLREVSLSGEAFFDVVHNSDKPFIIHTSKIDVRVVGTRFNVRSYPTDKTFEASLIRGSIEVTMHDRPNEKIILKPNEKIVVANDENIARNLADRQDAKIHRDIPSIEVRNLTRMPQSGAIAETSWVENKLVFQDKSFRDLASEMERWYGVSIQFDDSKRDTLHFTGSFENESIQEAMDALKLTKSEADFHYHIDGNKILITK